MGRPLVGLPAPSLLLLHIFSWPLLFTSFWAAGRERHLTLSGFDHLAKKQIGSGVTTCNPERDDEFFPNFGNFTQGVPVDRSLAGGSRSLFDQAAVLILRAIDAPIIHAPLRLGGTENRHLMLTGLYLCRDRPDAWIFAVSAGETVGNATKKVLLDIRAEYHGQEAWLTLQVWRIVLSEPTVTLKKVSSSFLYAPADAKLTDSAVSVSMENIPGTGDIKNFGGAFFLIKLQTVISPLSVGISTHYNLNIQLLDDVDSVCGLNASTWIRSAAPGRLVNNFDVPSTVVFAQPATVTVCSKDRFNIPNDIPISNRNDSIAIYLLPRYPLAGDLYRYGDADLSVISDGLEIKRTNFVNGMGEEIVLSRDTSALATSYSAQVETLGAGGYQPLSYLFAAVRCDVSLSLSTVSRSANASNNWLSTPVAFNLSVCRLQTRFEINVEGFYAATQFSSTTATTTAMSATSATATIITPTTATIAVTTTAISTASTTAPTMTTATTTATTAALALSIISARTSGAATSETTAAETSDIASTGFQSTSRVVASSETPETSGASANSTVEQTASLMSAIPVDSTTSPASAIAFEAIAPSILIDLEHTLWSETYVGSPALTVEVLGVNGAVLASLRSCARWQSQRLYIPRSLLVNASVLRGTVTRQEYYPNSIFGSSVQPQYPAMQVTASSTTVRAFDVPFCPTIQAAAPSTVLLTLCSGGRSTVQIPGRSVAELGQAAALTGYDLDIRVDILGSVDESIQREAIEISVKTLIPALASVFDGTDLTPFRNSYRIRVPSTALLPSLHAGASGYMTELQIENSHGVPVHVSVDIQWTVCSDDDLANGPAEYLFGGGSKMPELPLNGSGFLAVPPLSAWVCRGSFDYWKVVFSPDMDILQIDIDFFAFGYRYNSKDGSVFTNADQVALKIISPGGTELAGVNDVSSIRFGGRSLKLDLSAIDPRPVEAYLQLTSNGAAQANYTISLRWRKAFTTVGGVPVIRSLPAVQKTSTIAADFTSTKNASGTVAAGTIVLLVLLSTFAVFIMPGLICFFYRRRPIRASLSAMPPNEDSEYAPANVPVEMDTFLTSSARRLEGVQIQGLIGKGNFGSVWRALWCGTPVAAKTVDSVREIEGELKVLLRIDHPNCIHFLGIARTQPPDESRTRDYMVFELAEGSVLALLQQRECLPVARKLAMLRDAARGVNYLGSLGIVHRDLACRNLLYDRDRTLLSDFGLSRKYDGDFYMTSVEGAKAAMPIRWTAPEILKQGKATTASDCYSFAVLIWELFEDGNVPFGGVSNADVMKIAGEGGVADILRQPSGCPDALYDMMQRMWSPEPTTRPSFTSVLQLLESLSLLGEKPYEMTSFSINSADIGNQNISDYQSVG